MSSRDITFAAAGAGGAGPEYVDDVFSTYLYTGNGSTQTITNGIDLAGKGGLVWIKSRNNIGAHCIFDTARGVSKFLNSADTSASTEYSGAGITSFNANGFILGADFGANNSTWTQASWTFRKAPKFFDVVTYTGNGVAGRTVAHNLGSTPGMIIVKATSNANDWLVYHRSRGNTRGIELNTTGAEQTSIEYWNNTTPTSTEFTVGINDKVNQSGWTYVAYLFAHDAGGFGAAGTDNVISCGIFTTDSIGSATVDLGYEAQYLMIKTSIANDNWQIFDDLRAWSYAQTTYLAANSSQGELAWTTLPELIAPASTGFISNSGLTANTTYIYMAIRRPMKPPTVGTEVFSPVARTGTGANATVSSGFVTDTVIEGNRTSSTAGTKFGAWNRLRSIRYNLTTSSAAELGAATTIIQANPWDVMNGYKVGTTNPLTNANTVPFINWMFKRATGFHDVVCYTGTGVARTVAHNLGAVPELMIVKSRSSSLGWIVYANNNPTNYLVLNTTAATVASSAIWNNTNPTSNVFSVGTNLSGSGTTYVALLFATLPGISKVGSYTGNGTSQTINCGFTTGARFVLIKRTDAAGNWFVWDTARGIVAGNDPYLGINSINAEVAIYDTVDADSTGFIVNRIAGIDINETSATYIFFAIA